MLLQQSTMSGVAAAAGTSQHSKSVPCMRCSGASVRAAKLASSAHRRVTCSRLRGSRASPPRKSGSSPRSLQMPQTAAHPADQTASRDTPSPLDARTLGRRRTVSDEKDHIVLAPLVLPPSAQACLACLERLSIPCVSPIEV